MLPSAEACKTIHPVCIHVGTWNVNAKRPEGESLVPWLEFEGGTEPDIYVLGFQELVELSAKQVIKTDGNERVAWEQLILKTLNSGNSNRYVLLRSEQLVGACLCVFVKPEHVEHITNVDSSVEKVFLFSFLFFSFKGGLPNFLPRLDSLEWLETRVVSALDSIFTTLISALFAPTLPPVRSRLKTATKILPRSLKECRSTADGALRITSKFYFLGILFASFHIFRSARNVFWLGDFNYRIDLGNEEVRRRALTGDFATLIRYDQLNASRERGKVFQTFSEGPLTFAPTYKYDIGTNNYDTSEKLRVPSWTDRILWLGETVKQDFYNRAEVNTSDHRPVKSLFRAEYVIIDHQRLDALTKEIYNKYASKVATGEESKPALLSFFYFYFLHLCSSSHMFSSRSPHCAPISHLVKHF